MAAKKRNPQDSTRRNVQAGNKRDVALAHRVKKIEAILTELISFNNVADHKFSYIMDVLNRAPFASEQRSMGYRHSTSFPASIRVKG